MTNPVLREEFERRVRAWVEEDTEANQSKLRGYLERRRDDPAISFRDCDLDMMNEWLWNYAQSRSKLWAPEGLDELITELRKADPL